MTLIRVGIVSLIVALAGCAHTAVQTAATTSSMAPLAAATPKAKIPKLPLGASESQNLADIVATLKENTKRTLLVLDVDDTLLTGQTFYGSDAWYEWQFYTLKDGDSRKVPTCLFDIIAVNTELTTQKLTQDDGPAIINALLKTQDTLILTSRNNIARGMTLRELKRMGYELPRPLLGPDGVAYRSPRSEKDPTPVTVSYDEGVFMLQGADKGMVLREFLAKHQDKLGSYERVLLVDDGVRNHDKMEAAFRGSKIEYRGLYYFKIDELTDKEHVDADEENQAVAGWREMLHLLETTFPERLKVMRKGTEACAY